VPSPTFTLVQTYDLLEATVWHFDLYRLERPDDALELGVEEAFEDGICLVEWPDRLGALLPRRAIILRLTVDPDGTRRCALVAGGDTPPPRLVEAVAHA